MLKMFGAALWVMVAISAASDPASLYGTLESGQCYTWGINPRITLPLHSGQIITEAVLTVHNIRPEISEPDGSDSVPRSELRPGSSPDTETPDSAALRCYVLNNPRYGFLPLNKDTQEDPFARVGGILAAEYEQGNLVYRLSRTHDPNGWTAKVFGDAASLTLADGASIVMSSSLLEFIDYAGTGRSVGFGIRCGNVRYYYDDITLSLTVQSYEGAYTVETIVCHIADDSIPDNPYTLTVAAVNGSVAVSPAMPAYAEGQIVTLTAAADIGYTFCGWSGSLTGTTNPVTITMDGDKSITANFTDNSRSSQRGL